MAFWQISSIKDINEGNAPNDGTGDTIRDAFLKVDSNFSNVSSFLSSTTVDFLNANVEFNTNLAGTTNISNLFVANATGTVGSFTGNITVGNLNANSHIVVQGDADFYSNVNISGNILPAAPNQYDLGSITNPFRTIYYSSAVSGTTVQTTDAGLLQIHANAAVGDVKDVGLFGNVTHHFPSNTYAFFGYQYQTNDFVYKITDTDAVLGNSVVYDGVYGNVHFGGALLSNTTPSTDTNSGALIVAGGAGINGNINAGGNVNVNGSINTSGSLYSNGYIVLTSNTPGIILNSNINVFNNNVVFTAPTQSISPGTGVVVLSYGGLGVAGNINAGGNVVAAGLVGSVYGTIQTAAQPNITSVGTLPTLTVGTLNFTSLGGTSGTFTTLSAGSLSGLVSLTVNGNVGATNFNGNTFGMSYGNIMTNAQPFITSLGTLTGLSSNGNVTMTNTGVFVGNIFGVTMTNAQPFITSLGTLTALSVTGNVSTGNVSGTKGTFTNISGTLTGSVVGNASTATKLAATKNINGVAFDGSADITVTTSSGDGNLSVSGTAVTLPATGPGAITVGSSTSIPVVTTDAYGRVTTLTSASISTTLNLSANTGTGSASLSTQVLRIVGTPDITTSASGNVITITNNANLATVTARGASTTTALTLGNITVGNILPTGNTIQNIGNTTAWFGTFYGISTQAKYADLAEKYLTDVEYPVGTVVAVGGNAEVTASSWGDLAIGVVSDNPAYMMNSALEGGTFIALKGRVPVKVIGTVRKGQRLVAGDNGCAVAAVPHANDVFGVALESSDDVGVKLIEAVIL
jgi:hypothetical protein